ncbi:MAG TPA: tetratricopeptide repeat protein [Thermoanaerobaculia bacterium]|nr:tetratricopeptide repeat protein [Thermoanaerobaculia bacterium]
MRRTNLRFLLSVSLLLALAPWPALAATAPSEMKEAIAAQRKLAEASPGDASLWNDLGNLLWTDHQEGAAEAAYKHALSADSSNAAAHYNLGLLLAERGKLDQALKEYHSVLEAEPKSAWAHFQIGSIYQRQGHRHKAVAEYARAFSLNPNLSFADVNPQVVANPLVTEALLRAFHNAPAANLAPRSYSDPGHVAGLFLPPEPRPQSPAETPKSRASGSVEVPARLAQPAATAPAGPTTAATKNGRELEPKEAQPQVTAGSAEAAPATKEPGGVRRPIIVPQVVVPAAPAQGQPHVTTPAPRQPRTPPTTRGNNSGRQQPPPSSVPTTPSTGRLELHLVADSAPAA